MKFFQEVLLSTALIVAVAASHEAPKRKIVQGYQQGVLDMPPIDKKRCTFGEIVAKPVLSNPYECARTCHAGQKPKTCYYSFVVERYPINGQACSLCTPNITNAFCSNCQCVPADGVERMALTVNRMIPGPSIQVCLGDFVVVDVTNKIAEGAVSIHWHGLYQNGYQYSDGVPHLTQCPITSGTTFRYKMRAMNSGTHFWHAHTGLNKLDGIYGNFIVRDPVEKEPHKDLYEYDLANHVLLLADWMHEESTGRYPGRNTGVTGQNADTVLLNGKGRYMWPNGTQTNTNWEVMTVEANKRYRFRVINTFCTTCSAELTIQNHRMIIIASDGQPIKPIVVDTVVSFPGERFDFIVITNQKPGAYWMQVRALGPCGTNRPQQLGILQYKAASTKPKIAQPTYRKPLTRGVILNPGEFACTAANPSLVCINNLTHLVPPPRDVADSKPDLKFYLSVSIPTPTTEQMYQPRQYKNFLVPTTNRSVTATVDGIQFQFPSSPPISQLKDLPRSTFCNSQNLPRGCTGNCTCTHVLKIPLHSVVEIIFVDQITIPNLSHPFHLHGYSFRVLGMGQPFGPLTNKSPSLTVDQVKKLDRENKIPRNLHLPPSKDTVTIPNNGYVVLRFRADNPGFWLFHCHFVYHQIAGMEFVLQVGEPHDWAPVPPNFPKCGNFLPKIEPVHDFIHDFIHDPIDNLHDKLEHLRERQKRMKHLLLGLKH